MRKAYDTILLSEVDAVLAAKCGNNEPYRYECACCGEEVQICAVDSIYQVAHFRHKTRGNNDIACEEYLGNSINICIDALSRRGKRENVEFYFSNLTKTFSIGVKFSSNEIDNYKYTKSKFQIFDKHSSRPFYSIPICYNNFAPNEIQKIVLTKFSSDYYISNTLDKKPRGHEFFHIDKKNYTYPSFFKIQGEDENFNARLVRGKTLYTNTRYILVFLNQYAIVSGQSGVKVHSHFTFETMNRKFFAFDISFTNRTSQISEQLSFWGYSLESSETLTLLWPPAPIVDDIYRVSSEFVYVHSSFELYAHGNINAHSTAISKELCGISRVSIDQITKIIQKNTEISIGKIMQYEKEIKFLPLKEYFDNKFTISDNGTYFLLGNYGIVRLSNGQTVFLTPNDKINKYDGNYIVERILYCQQKMLTRESLLKDILLHYKRTEAYETTLLGDEYIHAEILEYIDLCISEGTINSTVKDHIREGLL